MEDDPAQRADACGLLEALGCGVIAVESAEERGGEMKLKIFTLRLNPTTGLFDEGELASFQLGKGVIEVSEHFLVHEKTRTPVKKLVSNWCP